MNIAEALAIFVTGMLVGVGVFLFGAMFYKDYGK